MALVDLFFEALLWFDNVFVQLLKVGKETCKKVTVLLKAVS
jgi:hypothetical protein